jgi:preprotein translocase subunit SecA
MSTETRPVAAAPTAGPHGEPEADASIWEKISDALSAFSEWVARMLAKLFGSSNERLLRQLGFRRTTDEAKPYEFVAGSPVAQVNELEERFRPLSDEELRGLGPQWKQRLANGEAVDQLLPEVYAACRESGRRFKNMRHFDVQILGGIVLHQGKISEMSTGEGKTLVATLPASLNALTGQGVHIVTVNDYLARRDCEWMTPIYQGIGVTAGFIQSDMDPGDRRRSYDCDITYGTNSEFGFDYLRDNMRPARWADPRYPVHQQQCQKSLNYAIIDEVDNILIDEARTPLIISGQAFGDVNRFRLADRVARGLVPGKHFEIKEKERTCHLTEEGVREAERLAGVESFYTAGNMEWPHLIDNALKAHHLYKRDVQYVVMPHPESGEMSVIIVDEFTGRLMVGRQWSDGLHQAVEAKEAALGVKIKEETQTLATVTLQNFFKLYRKLAGMTGTAMTEANEFWKIYKLEVVNIPTNRPLRRIDSHDIVFRYPREKWKAVADEITEVHNSGRPILVGTVSVEKSEKLGEQLRRRGIKYELLNAKPEFAAREAEIVAQAGRLGAVTIATNMAGRGTDIILGGNPEFLAWNKLRTDYATRLDVPSDLWKKTVDEIEAREKMKEEGRKVADLGGLHVIGTERHDARRIDNQLRGRCARQGDPGSSRFYVALEDDLMRLFGGERVARWLSAMGMEEGQSIESRMVTRQIEKAQKRVEERHFDQRKHLLEYDEVMDHQRKRVYSYRQQILNGGNCRLLIHKMLDEQVETTVDRLLDDAYSAETFSSFASNRLGTEFEPGAFGRAEYEEAVRAAKDQAVRQALGMLNEKMDESLNPDDDPNDWKWEDLVKFLKARWNITTSSRALKQFGRERMADELLPQIEKSINDIDLSDAKAILAPDFGKRSLCDWAMNKFRIEVKLDDIRGLEPPAIKDLLKQGLRQQYIRKDIEFPVQVGMARFMSEAHRMAPGGSRYDREGILAWAKERFPAEASSFNEDEFRTQARNHIRDVLLKASEKFYKPAGAQHIEDKLDEEFQGIEELTEPQARDLAAWAKSTLDLSLEPSELQGEDEEAVLQIVHGAFDDAYRSEMRAMERSLLLQILDTSWKDHLYVMDHLRQGIGLVGYAQIDPKTEYKREGMKLFDSMWERVYDDVTEYVFRMEEATESFAETVWRIGSATHAEAESAVATGIAAQQQQAIAASQQTEKKVEPIRNRGTKVGRNDPCPCGSGKKYKNCCMRTAV